jgi:hypothetical protein
VLIFLSDDLVDECSFHTAQFLQIMNNFHLHLSFILIYIKKRIGPNIEPCGTPHVIGKTDDDIELNSVNWLLLVR